MNDRFRREKNLSHRALKKNVIHQGQDIGEKNVHQSSFVQYFLDAYRRVKKYHILRDTILLLSVLFCVLLGIAWSLPKIFSLHFDFNTLLSNNPLVSSEVGLRAEDEGDFDILILGRGGYENDAPDLTDSIILLHFDNNTKSIITVSIPRDLLIQSKILGRVKINEVYSGMKKSLGEEVALDHLMEIVSQITGKNIQMYVMVDFRGFRGLIDSVGGIDIDVPVRLYDSQYPAKNWGYTIVDIPEGLQHFDGDKALKYARSRHTTSDFDRSLRQQLVIQALKEKMSSLDVLSSPKKIESIYSVINHSIQTNVSLKDIFNIAKTLSKIEKKNFVNYALNVSCFEALRLCQPGGLIYNPEKELFGGLSVLLPKKASPSVIHVYDTIRLFVAVITEYPHIQSQPGLAIVNASGKTNFALSIGLKLQSVGIPVDETQIKNQKEKSATTFIRYNSSIIDENHILLKAISLIFSGEKRPARADELNTMVSPYELVLGSDSSLYFQ